MFVSLLDVLSLTYLVNDGITIVNIIVANILRQNNNNNNNNCMIIDFTERVFYLTHLKRFVTEVCIFLMKTVLALDAFRS